MRRCPTAHLAALLLLLKFWRPAQTLGYGGVPVSAAQEAQAEGHGLTPGEVFQGWLPILILIAIVVAWTGPWSKLPSIVALHYQVNAASSLAPGATVAAVFNWTPFVGGSAILASWIVVALLYRINGSQLGKIFAATWSQMWGAMLVGVFIFGLAYVFNFSGMAGSLAKAFSALGPFFIIVAPLLGFIGVALSGSNTSTNAMFGKFTSEFVRNEGEVIRHNFGWTLILLAYLVLIGIACYFFFPNIAALPK